MQLQAEASEAYMRDHEGQQQGRAAERARIVEFLRAGVDVVRRQAYPRDREMHGYYLALAERIENGDHLK